MDRLDQATVDWLVDALDPARPPRSRGIPGGLTEAADAHGVPIWAYRHASRLGLRVPGLREAAHSATARHLRAGADLGVCARALEGGGIPFLVVKGAAVVATCHGGDPGRSYLDVDLAVAPRDVARAVDVLRAAGCLLLDANWPLLRRERVRELRLLGPAGAPVDLHWSLGYGPGAPRGPSVATLLARSRAVQVDGLTLRTLDPADTAVHLALHAASSGGNRLLWLADLRGALADVDPEMLGRRARDWRAAPAVALMMERAARVLGTDRAPTPRQRGAVASAWWALASTTDRIWPPELYPDGRSPSRLVARAAAETPAASLREAVRRSAGAVRPHGAGPDWVERLFDPDDPLSPFRPVGGSAAEAAFLADVAAGVDLAEGSR